MDLDLDANLYVYRKGIYVGFYTNWCDDEGEWEDSLLRVDEPVCCKPKGKEAIYDDCSTVPELKKG